MDWIEVESYGLDAASDRDLLVSLEIDVLLVLGWQRLIPPWLIEHCTVGAIGAHGSAAGIVGGRGRSPQNWALILGAEVFEVAIFFVDPGIDSGEVIDSRRFPLTERDDIRSSYAKATWCEVDMIDRGLRNGSIARREATPQTGFPRYLPSRNPEEGAIDWARPVNAVDRFVRALTRPYPGAFTDLSDGGRVCVWRAHPFDPGGRVDTRPGEILALDGDGSFIVSCNDGLLRVDDYTLESTAGPLRAGLTLPSVSFRDQMAGIVERHQQRYPDLPLADSILTAAGRPPLASEAGGQPGCV